MRYLTSSLIALLLLITGFYAWSNRYSEMMAIEPPPSKAFVEPIIAKGASLVAIGDCEGCHTKPGGKPFAGGVELITPFGAIFSSNITPDVDTGIGAWSPSAFMRAFREGVDRFGYYLYPAFPYEHFTKVTDDDIAAIYAYLMTRPPVSAPRTPNNLRFPFNIRSLVSGWNLLFLDRGAYTPDPAHNEIWNRGAYLVEGLGHCGACHTPLNILGAERGGGARLGGETLEGWHAPALNENSPAPVPWTVDAMVNFLLDGWDGDHGLAAGPMTTVVNGLRSLSESDAEAIATYIISFQDQTDRIERTKAAKSFAEMTAFKQSLNSQSPLGGSSGPGEAIFVRICANCHRAGTNTAPLAFSSVVSGPDPTNLVNIIDQGIDPPQNSSDRSMPAFRGSLTDGDLAELVTFIRGHFSRKPAWSNVKAHVAEARATGR